MTVDEGSDLLRGRRILVTGVSRRAGIGHELARSFAGDGACVVAHSWAPHDASQPWGADAVAPGELLAGVTGPAGRVRHVAVDLGEPDGPQALMDQAVELAGPIDTLVVNHAHSAGGRIGALDAGGLDRAWAVNARGTLLLVQAFAARFEGADGRIVLFTSGQHREPMPGELPYAVTKAAVQQATASLAADLVHRGITVNCVDPGPTDTGWADGRTLQEIRARHPRGRWGSPADAAALVSWLIGPGGGWVTGQTIVSDGGWGLRS